MTYVNRKNILKVDTFQDYLYLDVAAPPAPNADDFDHQKAVLDNLFKGADGIFKFLSTYSPPADATTPISSSDDGKGGVDVTIGDLGRMKVMPVVT